MRNYYDGTEYIIFDGTRLVSHSLGEKAYNHCNFDDPQMNLQYCFLLKPKKKPIYFRGFTGNKTDISLLNSCMAESGLKNLIFLGDKGYYSKKTLCFSQRIAYHSSCRSRGMTNGLTIPRWT